MQARTNYTHNTELVHCNLNLLFFRKSDFWGWGCLVWSSVWHTIDTYDIHNHYNTNTTTTNNNNNKDGNKLKAKPEEVTKFRESLAKLADIYVLSIYSYTSLSIYIYIHMYACMCIYIYIYIYIYTHLVYNVYIYIERERERDIHTHTYISRATSVRRARRRRAGVPWKLQGLCYVQFM